MRGRSLTAVLALSSAIGCREREVPIVVSIEPTGASLAPYTSQAFAATVDGSTGPAMVWSVVRGSGLVTTGGVYFAPGFVPSDEDNDIVVRATAVVDPAVFAEATVRIVPAPIEPSRGPTAGGTRVAVTGQGFASGTMEVRFDGVPGTDLTVESDVLLRVTTPPRIGAIGAADVDIRRAGGTIALYPKAFHFAATQLRFSGGLFRYACAMAYDVAAADLDLDGSMDLVVTCPLDDQIALMLNDGSGGLEDRILLPSGGSSPWRILTGDYDADGDPDLVIQNVDTIALLRNDAGTIVPVGTMPYAPSANEFANDAVIADLTGDDKPDIAFTRVSGGTIAILRNDGGDAFTLLPGELAVGLRPYSLAAGDLNADGNVDLVSSFRGTPGGFSVFLGTGGGGFAAGAPYPTMNNVGPLALGDFDADGVLDVAAGSSDFGSTHLTVSYGAGDGTFGAAASLDDGSSPFYTGSNAPFYGGDRFQAVDADLDGSLDLVTLGDGCDAPEKGPYCVRVFWGTPGGLSGNPYFHEVGEFPAGKMLAVDLDGRDNLELVFDCFHRQEVYAGLGGRVWGAPRLPIGFGATDLSSSDGDLIAVGGGSAGTIVLLPDADFVSPSLESFVISSAATATRLAINDLDLDGLPDAIVAGGTDVWALPGAVGGGYDAPVRIVLGTSVTDVAAGDLDGDGLPDLVVATGNGVAGVLQVLWGVGGFAFSPGQPVSAGILPARLTLADLDDDGLPEVLASDYVGSRLALVPFGGSRTPAAPTLLPVSQSPTDIVVLDVNEDYLPDVVLLGRYEGQVVTTAEVDVLLGRGGLEFDPPDVYRFEGTAVDLRAEDLDGDDLPDLAVVTNAAIGGEPNAVAVLRGAEGGRFRDPEYAMVIGSPISLWVLDFDGDGLRDLVVGDSSGGGSLRPLTNVSR